MGMYDNAQARTGGKKAENSPGESEQLAREEDREEHSDNAVKALHVHMAAHHRVRAEYHEAQAKLHREHAEHHRDEAEYHEGEAEDE